MFGKTTPDAVRLPYARMVKPGVRVLQRDGHGDRPGGPAGHHRRRDVTRPTTWWWRSAPTTTSAPRRVSPKRATSSTPSPGPTRLARCCPPSPRGEAIVGVCGAPFKCPPAPSEAALMLHDFLTSAASGSGATITLVHPSARPIPPSPGASKALVGAFDERNIELHAQPPACSRSTRHAAWPCSTTGARCRSTSSSASPSTASRMWWSASGLAEEGWVPVDPDDARRPGSRGSTPSATSPTRTCRRPGSTPRARPRAVAVGAHRRHRSRRAARGRTPGPAPATSSSAPGGIAPGRRRFPLRARRCRDLPRGLEALRADKEHFGASRRARWFGL